MTPRLPPRLRAVVALVPESARVVGDVAAGHGALSAQLVRQGVETVIATEVAPGPLAELRGNLDSWGLSRRVEVRSGFGLEPLRDSGADAAVIAGVGAITLLRIAAQAPALRIPRLVLQCMQGDDAVEGWLRRHGWQVLATNTSEQHGRTYRARLVAVVE